MTHYKFGFARHLLAILSIVLVTACSEAETADGPVAVGKSETAAEPAPLPEAATESMGSGTWGDIVYGNADAPVTVIEYASLTCPHCATFAMQTFPKIKADYIDSGKVRFVYRNFLLNRVDLAASTVARCGDDTTTKHLMKVFFGRQMEWLRAEDPLDGLAAIARRTANMSRVQFDQCLSNKDMHKSLVEMTTAGRNEFNISGTPTVIVNGKVLDGNSWDAVKEGIEAAL